MSDKHISYTVVEWFQRWNPLAVSWVLAFLSFVATVVLAVVGGGAGPASTGTSAFLVLVAAVLQWTAVNRSRASDGTSQIDPERLAPIVRSVSNLTRRTFELRELAEKEASDSGYTPFSGKVSVSLSWIEQGLSDAVVELGAVLGDGASAADENQTNSREGS